MSQGWRYVHKRWRETREGCAVCGKPDWCSYTVDGRLACCMRVPSEHPAGDDPTGGHGWIHRLRPDDNPLTCPPRRVEARQTPRPNLLALLAAWGADTPPERLEGAALGLGVTAGALARLGACWAREHKAWAFPMRDGWRKIVGIRLRAENGFKWAVTGGRNGLFWPSGGGSFEAGTLYICEGPTDTAAMLDMGFEVIGRASCNTGADLLTQALGRSRRNVVIVGDADEPKRRPDGTTWLPGREGAERLAEALRDVARSLRIIYPIGAKDVRAWVQAGATRTDIQMVTDNASYYR